jgi:protein TonB
MIQRLFFALLFAPCASIAQEVVYYDRLDKVVTASDDYDHYERIEKTGASGVYVRDFGKNDSLRSEGAYLAYGPKNKIPDGLHTHYYQAGGARWYTKEFKAGKLVGDWRSYYPGGQLKRIEHYQADTFVRGECFNEDGSSRAFTHFEQQPTYPGGAEALFKMIADNIKYPPEARKNNIAGKVITTFVVNKDGSVSDIKIARDIGGGCGEETLRILGFMERWTPGYQDDKPVKVRYSLPLSFKLESDWPQKKKRKRKKAEE